MPRFDPSPNLKYTNIYQRNNSWVQIKFKSQLNTTQMIVKNISKVILITTTFTIGVSIGMLLQPKLSNRSKLTNFKQLSEDIETRIDDSSEQQTDTLEDSAVQNILDSDLQLGEKVKLLQSVPLGSEVIFKGRLRTISTSGELRFNFVDENGEGTESPNANWFWTGLDPDGTELKELFDIDDRKVKYYEVKGMLYEYECAYWDSFTPYHGSCQPVVTASSIKPVYLFKKEK